MKKFVSIIGWVLAVITTALYLIERASRKQAIKGWYSDWSKELARRVNAEGLAHSLSLSCWSDDYRKDQWKIYWEKYEKDT